MANSNSESLSFIEQVKSFTLPFWMSNVMEMFERLAYYGVRVVIPIYIASAEDPMGLHFTHMQKGTIFAWWALIQSLLPMFTGGFADRYGYKNTVAFSIVLKILGYILMATQREYYPFLFGCLTLATGTAIFKPAIQGTLSQGLTSKNASIGWGFFYQIVNIGGFLGPPLAGILHKMSWPHVFYGCALIVSLNFFMLFTYKEIQKSTAIKGNPWLVLKATITEFFQWRLIAFIVISSGFFLMLYQLWDMLPNFIEDWVDTSSLISFFGLKEGLIVSQTSRGLQVKQEWLINLNSAMIIVAMIPIAALTSRISTLSTIILGTLIGAFGLVLTGASTSGVLCVLGILVFSIGEMAGSPKELEYLSQIAPPGKKGLYLGYAQVPVALGWGYGSLLGGKIYDMQGDKANLALRYLQDHLGFASEAMNKISRTQAMDVLEKTLNLSTTEVTKILWTTYHPYQLWYPFALIGVASGLGLFILNIVLKKTTQTQSESIQTAPEATL